MATGENRHGVRPVIGWDIGGAHTKMARLDGRGRVLDVAQYPCALWLGLDRLDARLRAELGQALGGMHQLQRAAPVGHRIEIDLAPGAHRSASTSRT